MVDGRRVYQWEGAHSVWFRRHGRLWVHNDLPRKQAAQELYFHASGSICNTLTCSHAIKLWDLRRCASPRELLRIQGFPEWFEPPRTCVTRLMGNAVAVPCAARACAAVVEGGERYIDLCAGIGGFACAMRDVAPDARCVGYSEVLPAAVACYAANFPDHPSLGDATRVAHWPEADVLTAGFPCQPFSTANSRARRRTHAKRDFFEVVLEAVRASGATRVVLENVPTLLTTGSEQWSRIVDALVDLGFERPQHRILNAADFGVPQERKRLYAVARRDGHPLHNDLSPPLPLPPRTCTRDVLEGGGVRNGT